jgi:murein DD-endopeptidase MepM/ murein hydrolase activator NlpD
MRRARNARGVIAAALVAALVFAGPAGIVWGVDHELREARQELRATKAKIRAREAKLRVLQREMNRLATSISLNQSQIDKASERMAELRGKLRVLEERTMRLQAQLDRRNREAYIQGPGAPVMYLLTATSADEAAARMSFLNEMNRRDEVLARKVGENAERLSRGRAEMSRLQRAHELALMQLEQDKAELRERMGQVRKLSAMLRVRKEEILDRISRIRPFAVCPIQGPVAIADDFGIWVQRSKARGGDHVHQGNDMMSPMGTPVVAPFDGVAVATPNKLGGLAVKVSGENGYVYMAHNSRYGQMGQVEAGDVVAYVGATGNTSAPHVHFQWHPGGGAAVDPHEFLLMVC